MQWVLLKYKWIDSVAEVVDAHFYVPEKSKECKEIVGFSKNSFVSLEIYFETSKIVLIE